MEVGITARKQRPVLSLALGLLCATLALALATLTPPSADAFGTFSNGTLTVRGGEGKVVPRCDKTGELTVSGVPVDNGPAFCRDLRQIDAVGFAVPSTFDFSQLPDDLGGGQGPIEIKATGGPDTDNMIGAARHINVLDGGGGSDLVTGGDLNDTLSGGASGDKIEGGKGKDVLRGGGGGDKLLGGPGRDLLKGGGGNDSLVGGPGKDTENQ